MRLDKALGLINLSRKEAKEAVKRGRVQVNGKTVSDSSVNVCETDSISLDGQAVNIKTHLFVMMNKPAGYISATTDPRGEPTVMELLPEEFARRGLAPVGRLDKDVTGLIILTDDGALTHFLISPKRGVSKLYEAECEGELAETAVRAFREGIDLGDFTAKPAQLEILSASPEGSFCRVTVSEGKFHQVKRMLEKVGCPVLKLKRLSMGGVRLDETLGPGEWRYLTDQEEETLYKAAGIERK
ncbi:MAG: rRNA pseudouridine synthase [Clostridiales bacterium]|nr:rRNA pseudouridine synthase [Clostridiales bacterium]